MIRHKLAQGFDPHKQIREEVAEALADDHEPIAVQSAVDSIFSSLVAEHEAEKVTWPAVTDCDRLDAASEQLNARGIMARHHWWCCGSCGASVIPAEFDRLDGQWQGVPIIGYRFYHMQDTESAVEGGGICLNFGSCETAPNEQAYEEQSVRVARTVCAALTAHGLKITWNGSYGQRPSVKLTWQRRARPRFCEGDR